MDRPLKGAPERVKMSFIGGLIEAFRQTMGYHTDKQEEHVAQTLSDADKLKTAWNLPQRDLGKTQQWPYRQQHERDTKTRRREQGYVAFAFGRSGQALGKSWETCDEYVSALVQHEKAARKAYFAQKARDAKAAAATE